MKAVVCRVGESLLGFKYDDVVGASEAKVWKVPEAPEGVLGAVFFEGKVYTAVAPHGVLGGEKIGAFVILRSGYAVGVEEIIGMFEVTKGEEVSGKLREYFERVYSFGEEPVFIVDESSCRRFPRFPEEIKIDFVESEEEKTPVKVEEGEEGFIVKGDEDEVAILQDEVKEVLEIGEMNRIDIGEVRGFVESGKSVYPVVEVMKVTKPKWVIVTKDVAILCSYLELSRGKIEKLEGGGFVDLEGKKIRILDVEEVKGMIR